MTSPAPVSPSAARALLALLVTGHATRPELSARLGVTKQTVSSAVAELELRGLAAPDAVQRGRTGRTAVRYALAERAGWVAGIDLGATRLRLAAARFDGTVVDELLIETPSRTAARGWPDRAEVAGRALGVLADRLTAGAGPLLGVGVALPRAVPEPRDLIGGPIAPVEADLVEALGPVPAVWAENDVTCEAIAQTRYGVRPAAGSVLHVHVGAGLGAAFLVDGAVLRGARGRAGEIGLLRSPIGAGTAEDALGAHGLLAAAGHSIAAPLAAAIDDLFTSAEVGDPVAEAAIEREAGGLALLLGSLAAILDPDLAVLSGIIGGRAAIRTRVAALLEEAGVLVPVADDPLGDGAAVLGAAALAGGRVLAALTALA